MKTVPKNWFVRINTEFNEWNYMISQLHAVGFVDASSSFNLKQLFSKRVFVFLKVSHDCFVF